MADKRAANRKWYKKKLKNDPSFRAQTVERRLKGRYGITFVEKAAMFEAQGGRCAVCGKNLRLELHRPTNKEVACIDHDHRTGKVRGLLCGHCNKALGLLQDDPMTVAALARYIETHGRITDGWSSFKFIHGDTMKKFLARTTFALAVLLVVAFGLTLFAPSFVEAQAPYFYTLVVNGNLKIKKEIQATGTDGLFAASDAFTTTATLDTVVLAGVTATDIFVVSIERQAAIDTLEVLTAIAGTDTLFVSRTSEAVVPTSALAYNYLRIRK